MTLLFALLLLLAGFGVGRAACGGLRGATSRWGLTPLQARLAECWLGIGLLSLLGAGLAAVGLMVNWLAWPVVVLAAAAGALSVARLRAGWAPVGFDTRRPAEWVGAATVSWGCLLLVLAMASPVLANDEYLYHVTFPRQWLARGDFGAFPYNVLSTYNLLGQAANLWPMVLSPGDVVLLKCRESFAAAGIALLLGEELRRRGHVVAGWVAAGGWLLYRETVEMSPSTFVDTSAALYFVLGVLLLSRGAGLLAAGAFFGFAIGTKDSMLFMVPAVLVLWVGVLAWGRRGTPAWGRAWRAGLVACAACLAIASPWLVRNAVVAGNPVAPFGAAAMAPGAEYRIAADEWAARHTAAGSLVGRVLALPAHGYAFARNVRYLDRNRIVAAWVLVALAATLSRRRPRQPDLFLFGIAVLLSPLLLSNQQDRHVFGPTAVAWGVTVGIAARFTLEFFGSRARPRRALLAALVFVAVAQGWLATGRLLEGFRARGHGVVPGVVVSPAAQHELLAANASWWPVREEIRAVMRDDSGLLLVQAHHPIVAWIDVPAIPNGTEFDTTTLERIAATRGTAGVAGELRRLGVTHVLEERGRTDHVLRLVPGAVVVLESGGLVLVQVSARRS